MAKSASLSQRLGVTRGKLVLVVVLAGVLVAVICLQFGGSTGTSRAASRSDAPSRAVAPPPAKKSTAPEVTPVEDEVEAIDVDYDASLNEQLWATPRLATVIEYDPFALPAKFPRPAPLATSAEGVVEEDEASTAERLTTMVEELQMQLEELRQRGVHVIVRERDGYVAMIGDRTVHVGDDINGFTVTAIEPNGVRVERKIQE